MKRNSEEIVALNGTEEKKRRDEAERRAADDHVHLSIDADKVLGAFGTFGIYQMLNCILAMGPSFIYASCMLVMPFLSDEAPPHSCQVLEHFRGVYEPFDQCNVRDLRTKETFTCISLLGKATFFEYANNTKMATLSADFDLVCERSTMREHGSSTFLGGSMVGSILIAHLSDKTGRKSAFISAVLIGMTASLLIPIARSYNLFLFLRAISGFGLGGNLAVAYVMMSEVVAPSFREYTPFITTFWWVAGYMWAGLMRLAFDDWRLVYAACCAPGLACISYFWIFPESLHWMVSNRRANGIRRYISAATRVNGLVGMVDINLHACASDIRIDENAQQDSSFFGPWKLMFLNPKVVYHFAVCCFLMISMNMTYWALSLFATDLSENKMTGFFLSGLIEVPGAIVAVIAMKVLKRKPVSIIMFLLTTISLLSAVYVPPLLSGSAQAAVLISMPLLAKMFNSVAWNVMPLAFAELTPTIIRNTFCGLCSFVGDSGSVVSPYLELLDDIVPHGSHLLICICSVLCVLAVLTMPETKGVHLGAGMESFDEGPFLRAITCVKSSDAETHAYNGNGKSLKAERGQELTRLTPSPLSTHKDDKRPTFNL